jgi:hypothetical protein
MAVHLEYPFEAPDLLLRLAQVRLEALLELRIRRFADHLRQGLRDLLLGVVDILQLVHEKIIERLDVGRK